MRNIRINEAESIFEPFYDGGDSYPGHRKYACLSEYTVDTHGGGRVEQTWWTAKVVVFGRKQESAKTAPVIIERECRLDIREYDVFRVFAIVSKDIRFSVICRVDGIDTEVICSTGYGVSKEYNGMISGDEITKIRMEFENLSTQDASGELIWLGLSNATREKKMLEKKSPYAKEWEGCFKDTAEIALQTGDIRKASAIVPQTGLYFDAEELEELRRKVKMPGFRESMDRLREEAHAAMEIEPEKEIGTFVHRQKTKRFVRERDQGRPSLPEIMDKVAFVGLIDEDMEMLRMACRMALSVAHCEYFCESIMGVLPGATWHHRSFSEEAVCKALIKVLEWAGGLLTWHGKNIIYDAIIMKGLPRLDADIKTMDYMWKMNQGPVFASCLVIVNLALQKRYPRYGVRAEEAERDLLTMWENYVQSDGGSAEGPSYWGYTLRSMIEALYLLARYHGKTLEDYIPSSIRKSSEYAYACLSDAGDYFVPVNDAHPQANYSSDVLNFLARMNVGDIWKVKSNLALECSEKMGGDLINHLIFGQRYEVEQLDLKRGECAGYASLPITDCPVELIDLPVTGHTTLRRKTEDLGTVGLHMISGLVTFGHAHADKGSFVLEAAGKALLIDRGVCDYDNAYASQIGRSELHNLVTAVKERQHLSQSTKDPNCGGTVMEAKYEDNIFLYITDVTACWNGVFEQNIRKMHSHDPYHYVIEDNIKIKPEYEVCFVLNTYGEIREEATGYVIEDSGTQLVVQTKNWKPERAEYGGCGTDGNGRPVNRLCLYIGGAKEYALITELMLQREDA